MDDDLPQPAAPGVHLQKVRVAPIGGRDVALLQVRVPGETLHVVVAQGLGVGLVGAEGRGRLREAMPGAVKPGAARTQVLAEQAARALAGQTREALEEQGARLVETLGRQGVDGRRDALGKALRKAIARIDRRATAVRGDLARAAEADVQAQHAQLFVAEAARARRGATSLVAVDWTSGEAREIRMPLDPARGAREQLDALFHKARRRKEGARIAHARLADADRALGRLRELLSWVGSGGDSLCSLPSARASATDTDLTELERQARAAAPHDFKLAAAVPTGTRGARPREQAPLPPYRTFLAIASDARILVGRGSEKNDALTFHVARPHDLWLHAKNRAGAHVVVPLDKNASCPADVLVDAAHLAAHFSEARGESVVEIQHTPRRYLRKPRGSAPGLVVVDREKVLVLRCENERLRTLLEREVEPGAGA